MRTKKLTSLGPISPVSIIVLIMKGGNFINDLNLTFIFLLVTSTRLKKILD